MTLVRLSRPLLTEITEEMLMDPTKDLLTERRANGAILLVTFRGDW